MISYRSLTQILVVLTLISVMIADRPAEAITRIGNSRTTTSNVSTTNLLSLEWVTAELLTGCNQAPRYWVL
jgi:hypothetical protein